MILAQSDAGDGLIFHDHGDPTDLEQLMLELMNTARADPGAEAARLGIDLNEGIKLENVIVDGPRQPLGFHPSLIQAARQHSQWMLDTDTFSHSGAAGSTASQRAQLAGYPSGVGENITLGMTAGPMDSLDYTYQAHDALFRSPDHRGNIYFAEYREMGIGLQEGVFRQGGTNWNTLSVTHDFGLSPHTPWPYLVGVLYYDFNENGAYDPGEGIGGVDVQIPGGTYYTRSASAGGYTLPRPASAGMREVIFTDGINDAAFFVEFDESQNQKLDWVPTYQPPVISGESEMVVGDVLSLGISPVVGATAFIVEENKVKPATQDRAEHLQKVKDLTSKQYSALSTKVRHDGRGAYRLQHSEFQHQILEYRSAFYVYPSASISFHSRLGWATPTQVAHLEVSDNDGMSWEKIYSQPGSGNAGEASFRERSGSLAEFAGKVVRIRFRYEVGFASFYNQTRAGFGWYVDAIRFNEMDELTPARELSVVPGEQLSYTPVQGGDVLLITRPKNLARYWPPGPAHRILIPADPIESRMTRRFSRFPKASRFGIPSTARRAFRVRRR